MQLTRDVQQSCRPKDVFQPRLGARDKTPGQPRSKLSMKVKAEPARRASVASCSTNVRPVTRRCNHPNIMFHGKSVHCLPSYKPFRSPIGIACNGSDKDLHSGVEATFS